jgi:hypothetical protein
VKRLSSGASVCAILATIATALVGGSWMEATVRLAGEGERVGGPTTVTIKATGEETNDSFYLGEVVIEPGFPGPPPHRHRRLHDMSTSSAAP